MENVNHICSCLKGLTEGQKNQANAIAGGSFEKLLVEFQILRTTSGEKNHIASSKNKFKNFRVSDIQDIFFLNQEKSGDVSLSLKKKFTLLQNLKINLKILALHISETFFFLIRKN